MCSFETLVTLDENLNCQGRECLVSTVRVVEVIPGTILSEWNSHLLRMPNNYDSEQIHNCFFFLSS